MLFVGQWSGDLRCWTLRTWGCIESAWSVQDLLKSKVSETEMALMVQSVEINNDFRYVHPVRLGVELRVW